MTESIVDKLSKAFESNKSVLILLDDDSEPSKRLKVEFTSEKLKSCIDILDFIIFSTSHEEYKDFCDVYEISCVPGLYLIDSEGELITVYGSNISYSDFYHKLGSHFKQMKSELNINIVTNNQMKNENSRKPLSPTNELKSRKPLSPTNELNSWKQQIQMYEPISWKPPSLLDKPISSVINRNNGKSTGKYNHSFNFTTQTPNSGVICSVLMKIVVMVIIANIFAIIIYYTITY